MAPVNYTKVTADSLHVIKFISVYYLSVRQRFVVLK